LKYYGFAARLEQYFQKALFFTTCFIYFCSFHKGVASVFHLYSRGHIWRITNLSFFSFTHFLIFTFVAQPCEKCRTTIRFAVSLLSHHVTPSNSPKHRSHHLFFAEPPGLPMAPAGFFLHLDQMFHTSLPVFFSLICNTVEFVECKLYSSIKYFWLMSSKSILIILISAVSKLVHFFRHSVLVLYI